MLAVKYIRLFALITSVMACVSRQIRQVICSDCICGGLCYPLSNTLAVKYIRLFALITSLVACVSRQIHQVICSDCICDGLC